MRVFNAGVLPVNAALTIRGELVSALVAASCLLAIPLESDLFLQQRKRNRMDVSKTVGPRWRPRVDQCGNGFCLRMAGPVDSGWSAFFIPSEIRRYGTGGSARYCSGPHPVMLISDSRQNVKPWSQA